MLQERLSRFRNCQSYSRKSGCSRATRCKVKGRPQRASLDILRPATSSSQFLFEFLEKQFHRTKSCHDITFTNFLIITLLGFFILTKAIPIVDPLSYAVLALIIGTALFPPLRNDLLSIQLQDASHFVKNRPPERIEILEWSNNTIEFVVEKNREKYYNHTTIKNSDEVIQFQKYSSNWAFLTPVLNEVIAIVDDKDQLIWVLGRKQIP